MLRFDDCICGTTTTGTGTLTLAAPPAAFGGIDPDVWARAAGFGNSVALLVDYVLTEYTDSTNLKEKSKESGVGTLTLGGSSGIANCTLARTTMDWSATSLDSQPATVNIAPGTGISVGTAANVLLMISQRAETSLGLTPYFDNALDALGAGVPTAGPVSGNFTLTHLTPIHVPILWPRYMAVKRMAARVNTAYTGGTSSLSGAIYLPNSVGRPGKLLANFGSLGSMGATGNIQSSALGTAAIMTPGIYIVSLFPSFTGGSGTPLIKASGNPFVTGTFGTSSMAIVVGATTSSGASSDDPATTTGWTAVTSGSIPFVALAAS